MTTWNEETNQGNNTNELDADNIRVDDSIAILEDDGEEQTYWQEN